MGKSVRGSGSRPGGGGGLGAGWVGDGFSDCLEEMPPHPPSTPPRTFAAVFFHFALSLHLPKLSFPGIFELHSQDSNGTDRGVSFLSFLLRHFLAPLLPSFPQRESFPP